MIRWVTLYGRLANVASLSRKMKKLGKFGFYLEVEELLMDERKRLFKIATVAGSAHNATQSAFTSDNLFIDLDDLNDKSITIFKIEVYGPRKLKVGKDTTGLYRVVQEDNNGNIAWSVPVDYKKAKEMFLAGTSRDIKLSLVKVLNEART